MSKFTSTSYEIIIFQDFFEALYHYDHIYLLPWGRVVCELMFIDLIDVKTADNWENFLHFFAQWENVLLVNRISTSIILRISTDGLEKLSC